MEAHWLATRAAETYLPPYGAADANTELIRTYCSALLPFVAVHHCLALLSMQQLWIILGQPLVNSSWQVKMGVLLDWIHVASILSMAQIAPIIQLVDPPVAPLADTSLLGYLHHVLQRWLPGLLAPAAIPQVTVQALQVIGILQQLVDDQQA